MQKKGYRIELYYIGVNNLLITTKRIQERVKRGEHHVPPNEVFARYESGLKLMRHYFHMPDKILFIDNTNTPFTCLEAEKGTIVFQQSDSPQWVKNFIDSMQIKPPTSAKSLNSIDEVRELYTKTKPKKDDIL
ncbi:MAG TPA: hypothetical protein VI233_16830 [Puia sp.]